MAHPDYCDTRGGERPALPNAVCVTAKYGDAPSTVYCAGLVALGRATAIPSPAGLTRPRLTAARDLWREARGCRSNQRGREEDEATGPPVPTVEQGFGPLCSGEQRFSLV